MSETVNVIARVPKSLHERLRQAAFDQHTSINKIVNAAIAQWLDSAAETGRE